MAKMAVTRVSSTSAAVENEQSGRSSREKIDVPFTMALQVSGRTIPGGRPEGTKGVDEELQIGQHV
jgi:hypothetical protein